MVTLVTPLTLHPACKDATEALDIWQHPALEDKWKAYRHHL